MKTVMTRIGVAVATIGLLLVAVLAVVLLGVAFAIGYGLRGGAYLGYMVGGALALATAKAAARTVLVCEYVLYKAGYTKLPWELNDVPELNLKAVMNVPIQLGGSLLPLDLRRTHEEPQETRQADLAAGEVRVTAPQ